MRRGKLLRRIGLGLTALLGLALIAAVAAGIAFYLRLDRSQPRLEGTVEAEGLSAPVRIERDAAGVPTVTASSRADLAFATGYLHAQERFFQMDLMRRAAAGELGALVGAQARETDTRNLRHLFRPRARRAVAQLSASERAMVMAYVAGVNRGLGDLEAAPFEYMLLRKTPEAWSAEDSMLAVYAMYLNLEGGGPDRELNRARAAARVGRPMAAFLYGTGSELDAALDGSLLPPPDLPSKLLPAPGVLGDSDAPEPPVKGSNNWAVSGALTGTGAAMVANDMHLGLILPNTWYRARLIIPGSLDLIGVTLPGIFPMVSGSNGQVAWGLTVAYADTRDAVIVEPVPGREGWYKTPQGPRPIRQVRQRLCTGSECRDFDVRTTIWGPIIDVRIGGYEVADRWTAHDEGALRFEPFLALERAGSVDQAIAAGRRSALPHVNMVVGDRAGHIGWTVMGPIPRRFGLDGGEARSWADGSGGWAGNLSPDEVPAISDPASGRLWTANSRTVGGQALRVLGDGGYDDGARAGQVKRRLFERGRFAERDMMAIQLDTTAPRMPFWRDLMLAELVKRRADKRLSAMIAPVRGWDGRAEVSSVGYRLIRAFRFVAVRDAYLAYAGKPRETARSSHATPASEQAMRTLLRTRPQSLVPPGAKSWDAFLGDVLNDVAEGVEEAAGGKVDRFTWGGFQTAGIGHPLARAIPLLGRLTDPEDGPLPGDNGVVRAQGRGFGASDRLVVSPGHERQALFHMPGGQSGAPFAPYYLAGHRNWAEGRPTPLLPGATRWRLTLMP